MTHLLYFKDAIQLNSVKLAAERNNVTHSTISQGILKLEEAFGFALTYREKRVFKPTPQGMYVFEQSLKLIESLKKFENEIQDSHSKPHGVLSFASSQSIMSFFVLDCFSDFEKQYPEIDLKFDIGRTKEIKSFVDKGQVEFGLTLNDGSFDEMEKIHLRTGKFILVTHKKNTAWKNSGFVLTKPRPETLLLQQQYRKKEKCELKARWVVDSWSLAARLAEVSNAVTLVPDFVLLQHQALKKIDWPVQANYELFFFHRPHESLSMQAKLFLKVLKKKTQSIKL